jgi:hypothetical protein
LLGGAVAVLVIPSAATAQQADVTFAKDIAPILQAKCENCHRPGTAAPMALRTYEEVRPWAPLIKDRVMKRVMPPWPLDKTIGIQDFKNDISLSDEQIQTIIAWVDNGAPLGNAADLPAPRQWPDPNSWAYESIFGRPPDLVVESTPYVVVASGKDQWPTPRTTVTGLTEEKWIRAIELRPGNTQSRYVFHHANPSLRNPDDPAGDDESQQLTDSAVGTEGFIFPEDSGRLIKPGATISWGMHYYPINEDVEATLVIGLWFHDQKPPNAAQGEVQLMISQGTMCGFVAWQDTDGTRCKDPQLTGQADVLLPPNSLTTMRGVVTLPKNVRIHSLRGHMHFRGKYQVAEVVYPDGRWEVLNKMDWDHAWHTAFLYEDWAMPLLPKGTTLILTSVFDNTANNRYNPDPNQWVGGGDRSVDEMSHLRFGMTFFEDEPFAQLLAEREAVLAERARQAAQQAADNDR